jgi:asparagine synthetase B (glutamine-hydrolysing)
VTNADLLSGHYWDYARISVDHDKTPEEFVNEGTRLVRQAIKRRCTGLKECVVMLSGGYDSRCIAGTISRYTKVRLQTFTTRNFASIPWGAYWTSYVDAFLGREVAKRLGVRNTYVPTPSNLWQEYFVKKNFLVDAMTYEHLWMLPLIDKLEMPLVGFDGLGGDYLLKGVFLTRRNLANTRDLGKLAAILNAEMRSKEIAPETISDFFCTPVREQLQPDPRSLLDELRHIGEHENPVIIFLMTNRARNVASLLPNSIAGTRIPCVLPFTDNDLVEFSLSIPPLTKMSKQIYFRILKKLFPDIMRIPSANWWGHPSNIKEATIHHLLLTIVQMARSLVVTRISDTRRKLQREAIEYLMGLISSVRNPPFLDVDKVRRTAQQYLNHKKDPSTFLVAIADFCIWYNRYFDDGNQSHTKHGFPSSVVYHESGAQ